MNRQSVRQQVSAYSKLIHSAGWVANHDGNISLRADGRFFITPSGVSKRLCEPETIVECGLDGRKLSAAPSGPKPPSEVLLHVGAYAARPDAQAVIHAHPPHVSAFALAGASLGPVAMPEVVVSLGEHIPLVPLFAPKDAAVVDAVARALALADVAVLAGNGAIAVGADLEQAYLRMELLEHYARILAILRGGLGAPAPLDPEIRARLVALRRDAGLERPGAEVLARIEAAPPPGKKPAAASAHSSLRAVIAEEVRRALGAVE